MDVLVIVGDGEAPERLRLQARHVVRAASGDVSPELLADIRTRIPRHVSVVGGATATDAARLLHRAGFPVTLHTDAPPAAPLDGVRVLSLTDSGATMEVAASLLDQFTLRRQ